MRVAGAILQEQFGISRRGSDWVRFDEARCFVLVRGGVDFSWGSVGRHREGFVVRGFVEVGIGEEGPGAG